MVCEERYAITAVNEPWLSQAPVAAAVQCAEGLLRRWEGDGDAGRAEAPCAHQGEGYRLRHSCRPAGNAVSLAYAAHDPGLCRRRRGLGLPLAHQIARLHGGQLLLNSREGQGTTATIALPMVRGFGDAGREHRGLHRRLPAGTAGAGGRAARRGIPGKASGRIRTRCRAEGRRGTAGTRPCLLWRSSPDSFPHFPESMRRR